MSTGTARGAAAGPVRSVLLAVLVLVAVLPGCAERIRPDDRQPAGWSAHHRQHEGLQHWRMAGRMAIQTAFQGGSVDVFWVQRAQDFRISLVAPLGQGALQLSGNGRLVEARLADGSSVSGDPAALMMEHFGVRLPVAELVYWLRGLARDARYETASWNEQGRLYTLEQQGWKIELRDYRQVGDYTLPTRYYMEPVDDDSVNVRLVVRDWMPAD